MNLVPTPTQNRSAADALDDFRAIADRVEIEALRGEFTDAAMMRDRARLASLFTPDGVLRMPNVPAEMFGRDEIRAGGERLQAQWDFFVQTTHPGTIQIDGDTAIGRAYIQELARTRDGRQGLNFAVYHDRYRRTGDGWKFTERVYEVRYLDTTPLAGAAPDAADGPASFTDPAPAERLERAAAALRANGFTVDILDDAAAARARVKDLIPRGRQRVHRGQRDPPPVRHRRGHQHQRPVRRRQAARPGHGPRHRRRRHPAADRQPRRRRRQRRRGHRDRLPRGRLGQRKPAPRLRRRRRAARSGSSGRRRWCPT